MADLFSDEWAQAYKDAWNSDDEITGSLARAGFNSVVAFGLPEDSDPAFVMTIQNGMISSINNSPLDDIKWDIRATRDD